MWDERGPLVRRHHRLININIDPAALGAPGATMWLPCMPTPRLALADILDELGVGANLLQSTPTGCRACARRAPRYEGRLAEMARDQEAT